MLHGNMLQFELLLVVENSMYIPLFSSIFAMSKCGNAALEKIYECDKETGAFIISIALDNYPDVFNELDSAPWRRRDIDHDLRVFLEESSADIPMRHPIILRFNVEVEKQDPIKEEHIKTGLRTYFSFVRSNMQRQIRDSYQKSVFYVMASFLLLFTSYTLRPAVEGNIVFATLVDGISIGGWVFLWEAISTYAFKSRDAREKLQHYKRFSKAPIWFSYRQPPTNINP
jgi:hypothetical protein